MITYTDYILSGLPYVFIKMADSPSVSTTVGGTGQLFFLDWSSNRRNNNFFMNASSIALFSPNRFTSSGYFQDSSPLGGINAPFASVGQVNYAGMLSQSGIYNRTTAITFKYEMPYPLNRPLWANPPSNKRIRVEFFLDGAIGMPIANCKQSGEIYVPMFKIGPFSFWCSKFWSPPVTDNSCSTPEGPTKIYMMLDTHTHWKQSNGRSQDLYSRIPLWRLLVSGDPTPNSQGVGGEFFPIDTIAGIEEIGDSKYITMENVNQTTFQKVLPTLPENNRYLVSKDGYGIIPVNAIELVGNDVVFTTDTPHALLPEATIDQILGSNPDNPILDPVVGSDDTFKVETVINSTQFSVSTREIKLFPNYWYSSFSGNCITKLDLPVHWWSPYFKDCYQFKTIQMHFNDPHFVIQEEDIEIDHISIRQDINGLPDARVCLNTTVDHGLVNNELVEIVYGENLDKVWGPFKIEVIADTVIALPYKKALCSKFIFRSKFRRPSRIIGNKTNNRVEVYMLAAAPDPDDPVPSTLVETSYISGRKMLFFCGKMPNDPYADSLDLETRFFDVDIIGLGPPYETTPPNNFPSCVYLNYDQFYKNIHLPVYYTDNSEYWLSEYPTDEEQQDGSASGWWMTAACIKHKEIRVHDYSQTLNMDASTIVKTDVFTYRVTSIEEHKLVPARSVMVEVSNVTTLLTGGWVSSIVDAYVFEITANIHTPVPVGFNIGLTSPKWGVTQSIYPYFVEIEFETEEEREQLFELNAFPRSYIIDYKNNQYSGTYVYIHEQNTKAVVVNSTADIVNNLKIADPFPDQDPEEFFDEMFEEPFPAVIRRAKRLYTKYDTVMYSNDDLNPSKNFFKDSITKSGCNFNEITNTLTIKTSDNHDLVNGQKVKLKGMTYFSSNHYPQEALGRESVKHFSMVFPHRHIYYIGTLDNCPACIKTGLPEFSSYVTTPSNDYYVNVTINDLYVKALINSLENDTFTVSVINSKEFSVTVDDATFNFYDYVPGIPEIDKISLRINYSAEFTQVDNGNQSTLTFDVETTNGLLNGRRYFLNIGAEKPFAIGQDDAVINPSDGLNLRFLRLPNATGKISPSHPHRIILEWEQYTNHLIRVNAFIDGNTPTETLMSVYQSDIIDVKAITEEDLLLARLNPNNPDFQNLVEKAANTVITSLGDFAVASYYNSCIGAFSFTFGLPFWDEVLSRDPAYLDLIRPVESWAILRGDKTYFRVNGQPIPPLGDDDMSPMITRLSDTLSTAAFVNFDTKTVSQQFVSFMMIGADHTKVKSITVSPFGSKWEVRCNFGATGETDYHSYQQFCVDDWVELGRSRQRELNRKWQITSVGHKFVAFLTSFSNIVNEDCRMNTVMLKKLAVRETGTFLPEVFSWGMTGTTTNTVTFNVLESNFGFNFSIQDTFNNTTARTTDNASSGMLFLKGNMKNNFSILSEIRSKTKDPLNMHWNVIGDTRRVHLALAYGRNEITHHQLLTMGWIRDLVTDSWERIFQAYDFNDFGNPGQSLAFTSAKWVVIPSGHLLCQGTTSSTARSKTTMSQDNDYFTQKSSRITGFHLFPAPIPERAIDDINFS